MALVYTDFSNGDTLLSIRDKLNVFNNNVVADVNGNTTDISNADGRVTTNTNNIATNTADIATNVGDITNNAAAIGINAGNIAGLVDGTTLTQATAYETGLAAPTEVEGVQFYDDAKHVVSYYTDIPGVTANGVLEDLVRIEANDGATIPNGTPVYFDHTVSATNVARVKTTKADTISTSQVGGVVTHDVPNATEGWMTTRGTISDINFSTLAETGINLLAGDALYISSTEKGKYTNIAPDISSVAGTILKMSTGIANGILFVSPRSLITTPNIFGYMQRLDTPTFNLISNIPQDITGYSTTETLLLTADAGQGYISTPEPGVYELSFYISIKLDVGSVPPQNGVAVVEIEIRDRTGNNPGLITMHIHHSEAQTDGSYNLNIPITSEGNEEWTAKMTATSGNIDLDVTGLSFDVKSRHLRR